MGGGVMRTVAKAAASVGAHRTGQYTPCARAREADERELAGGEEEEALFGSTLHLSPPSLEEAKEAASDLKEALSGLYSPHAETRCFGRSAAESSPTPITTQPFSLPPPPPRHIAKALALLQECSDVQKIVASLAADEKIWDAVMNNEKVLKYCAANRICTERTQESVNESETDVPSPVHKGSPPPSSELGFIDFMKSLKLKVREMVSSLSDLFESFMTSPRGAGSNSSTAIVGTSTSNRNFEDHTAAGASFVALTIATIILLILKRGDNI